MNDNKPIGIYIILYIPWLLSLFFDSSPIASYLIAWLGSFFIFYITLTGKLKPLPNDRGIAEQLMRPIFLVQIIFAGYMCSTSIFYFLDVLGYQNFKKVNNYFLIDQNRLMITAQCQRYYCLAHAAFVSGILIFMKYPVKQKYYIEKEKLANLLFKLALAMLPISTIFLKVPGLAQYYFKFSSLSFIAGTLALAFAIPLKKPMNTLISLILFIFNFYQALISGFKEPIIISIVVLGLFLYPNYKKVVTITFVPLLMSLFLILPTYNRVFRQNSWSGETGSDEASQLAINAVMDISHTNDNSDWAFYTSRLSEIGMFATFVQSTPTHIDYYGTKLLEQSAMAIIPRIFWPSKLSTEQLIMERVYNAGVVQRGSNVSAKPAFIADAYLSGGTFGVFFFLFIYGAVTQLISLKAEELFGGYILGTALMFSGLFQILWRGTSFEFLINSVFWSYISMLVLFKIFKATKILNEIEDPAY
ncbi:MAG: hypothetical protein JWR67_1047 [Mucilaginibacter sp.]|nr:hypothetical protein [Mucilaginibacter sp.]